jgi:hypothetical protein
MTSWIGVFKRKSLAIVAIGILTAACGTGPHAEARKVVQAITSTTLAATTTTSTTTTLPPTTTTTVPPTTTTTIATRMVPNATELGGQNYAVSTAEEMLTQAGFTVQILTASPLTVACYTYSALGQQPVWNTNEVVGQYPSAGTVAPIGSTVQLQVCGAAPP